MDLGDFVHGLLFKLKTEGQPEVEKMKGSIDDLMKSSGAAAPAVDKLGEALKNMGAPTNALAQQIQNFGERVSAVQRQIDSSGQASINSMLQAQKAASEMNEALAKLGITMNQLPTAERKVAEEAQGIVSKMIPLTAATKEASNELLKQVLAMAGISTGGLNVESMLERVGLRFTFITLLLRPLVDAVKQLIEEHEAYEEALRRTSLVLQSFGDTGEHTSEDIGKLVTGLSHVSGAMRSDLLGAFDQFMLKTEQVGTSLGLMSAAEEISQVTGRKLEQAVTDIEGALDGNAKKLAEYGIHLDDATVLAMKFADAHTNAQIILENVQKQLGTANEVLVNHGNLWQKISNWISIAATAYGYYNDQADRDAKRGGPNAPGVNAPNKPIAPDWLMNIAGSFPGGGMAAQGAWLLAHPEAAGFYGFGGAVTDISSQPSAYSLGVAAHGPSAGTAGEQAAISQALEKNADDYDKVADAAKRLSDSLDPLKAKQDGVKASIDGVIERIDKEAKFLTVEASGYGDSNAAAAQKLATLEQLRQKLLDMEPALMANVKVHEEYRNAVAQAADADRKATAEVTAFGDQVAKAAGHNEDLTPFQKNLQQIDEKFQGLRDSGNKLVTTLVSTGDILRVDTATGVPFVTEVSDMIDSLQQFDAEARRQAENDFVGKAFDRAEASITKFLTRIEDAQRNLPSFIGNQLGADEQALFANVQTQINSWLTEFKSGALSPEQFAEDVKALVQGAENAGRQLKNDAVEAGRLYSQELQKAVDELGSIFSGFAEGGLGGLESALQGVFKKTTADFGKFLATSVIAAFGGAPQASDFKGPNAQQDYQAALAKSNEQTGAIANAALTAGAGIENAIQNGTKETVAQMAVSAAATGYSVALALQSIPVYGTIAGIVVGLATFAAGLFSPADNTGKYYTHINVTNGQVDFGADAGHNGLGYSPEQIKEIYQSIQNTIDTFENGYVKLMFDFGRGADLMAEAGKLNLTEAQTAWNSAASKGFNDAMNAWIKTGLPGMIQDSFAKPLEQGLESIGFSTTAAASILAKMNTMAPEDALKYVTALVQAVNDITDALAGLKTPVLPPAASTNGFDLPGFSVPANSLWQQAANASNPWQVFMDNSTTAIGNVQKLAAEIPNLAGQDEVAAIQEAANDMKKFRQDEIQLLQQLQSAQKAVSETFDNLIEKYTLQGFTKNGKTDYAGEIAYLNQERQAQLKLALTSTDPAVVQAAAQKAAQLLDQMGSLAEQAGPQNAAAWQKYIIEEAKKEEDAINAHLQGLADPLIKMNQEMVAAMQPVIDAFLKLGEAMGNGPSATPTGTSAPGTPGNRGTGNSPGSAPGDTSWGGGVWGGVYIWTPTTPPPAGIDSGRGGGGISPGDPTSGISLLAAGRTGETLLDSQRVSAATLQALKSALERKMAQDQAQHTTDAVREDQRMLQQLALLAAGPKESQLTDVIDLLAQIRDYAASGDGKGDLHLTILPNNSGSTFNTRVVRGRTGG